MWKATRYESWSRSEVPVKREQTSEKVRRRAEDRRVRRNQEKALQMDLPFVIALTAASICTLYICVDYLHMQSSIAARIHNIEQYEKELEVLKAENDASGDQYQYLRGSGLCLQGSHRGSWAWYMRIEIRSSPINKTESEYVRQYDDIPKH